jgi:hypothetical protein
MASLENNWALIQEVNVLHMMLAEKLLLKRAALRCIANTFHNSKYVWCN